MENEQTHPDDGEPGWLAEWTLAKARPEFRADLRERFVAGAPDARALDEPTGDQERRATLDMTRLEQELDPMLAALDAPLARGVFRDELREQFLAAEPGPGAVGRRAPRVPRSARNLSFRWRLLAGAFAAAAAAWLVWLRPVAAPDPPGWRLVADSFSDPAQVLVDGVSLAGLDRAELTARVAGAMVVRTNQSAVRLTYEDALLVELAPESSLELFDPAADGEFSMRGSRGGFHVATGPGLDGRRVSFDAPALEAVVVGTIFGIDITDDYTCCCCFTGEVEVRTKSDEVCASSVRAGSAGVIGKTFNELIPMPPEHAEPLAELASFWTR